MGSLMYEPKKIVVYSAADLSAYEYVFVKVTTGDTDAKRIVALCGAGEVPLGILIKGEAIGRPMEVIPLNGQPAKAVASTTIAIDATCKVAANGQLVATTADGNRIFFIAQEAATATGDIIVGYTTNMFRGS